MTVPKAAGSWWVLLGAGGHARSVADVLERRGDRVAAVAGAPGEERHGWSREVEQLDGDEEALSYAARHGACVTAAFGANAARDRTIARASARVACPPVVATTATVSTRATLGDGTQVLEHAHVGPGASLGRAVIVNTAAVVEHDCEVGHGVHVSPGAVLLGHAAVGDGSMVGSGARVLPGVRVGAGCVVAAGAVVIRDVPDGARVSGVPARTMDEGRGRQQ